MNTWGYADICGHFSVVTTKLLFFLAKCTVKCFIGSLKRSRYRIGIILGEC